MHAGLASYRIGDLEAATRFLELALAKNDQNFYPSKDAAARLLLGMIHHRKGEHDKAQQLVAHARQLLPAICPRHETSDARLVFAYDHNVLICWLLLAEARSLLQVK